MFKGLKKRGRDEDDEAVKPPPARSVLKAATENILAQLGVHVTTHLVPTEADVNTCFLAMTATPPRPAELRLLELPDGGRSLMFTRISTRMACSIS